MNRAIKWLSFIVISLFVSTAAMADEASLQPQQWQPIQVEAIAGNIPELRGMPINPQLQLPASIPEDANETVLGYLGATDTIAFLVYASLFAVIALFIIFIIVNGISRLDDGYSGKLIKRWSGLSISVHWLGAIACMLLILTGLVLAGGRLYLEPSMNQSSWASLVGLSSGLHELMAFPFILGYILMILMWAPKQIPASYDLKWFAVLGGYLNTGKKHHPDAGFANAGEKLWFWVFALFGGLMVISGLTMMFPETFVVTKNTANTMLLVHIVSTIIITAFSVVHIFMATVMSEGGMSNMTSGYCDENWAKQHHNLWLKELKQQA
ncbi:formate dehydrogenase subunit gamma [Shewanella fidelis]|uniref:Formate dehydrogenase subunit gamma n=1 Tax=Shewanella fidelis TaxID=173509 RepID=A0AAW8NV82_9GAMM|nr:formate dehydrogenase subunit gamma [Shewanella fidelis]MDR8526121.1 formate dehydrogenase subunit gamma [Shewanella fidelis]MDW4813734.1 formate dehydrogenase subunit gamma [Shewanella fidelis]MDW4817830.1 formate dehydrogenase subunit gamma [Shewanella fidelis]MDW4821909.1 formate dehydrogenase subunit gamma [Shewanella fidelis]MDW4826062.1 formate dehydrogenase subunit gamma [Shewanella fidelis]